MIDLFLDFMSERFLDGLNYAIQAGWIVLAILVIRILPIRLPKWSICLLWGLVALRLMLPFQIEFDWSLQPSAQPIPQNIAMERVPEIDSGVEVIDRVVNPVVTESFAPDPVASANPLQILIPLASVVWLLGIAVMLLYALISTLRLGHRVKASVREGKYYLCDDIQMPFVFGLVRPKIYLPSGISVNTLPHVLAHEERHIKRLDHLWKPLGFLILSIYWFHPLLWVGYILFCRDLEKACDEAVVGKLDQSDRKAYSEALLSVSMGKMRRLVCPLAFGEEGVKGRIQSVLHYKKPGFWIILVAILLVITLAVGFLTSPEKDKEEETQSSENLSAEGITLHLISCEERDGIPSILVEWENQSDDILEYGTTFTVYKDGKLHEPREEVAWLMPLFMVERGGSQTEIISFWAWDMTEPGKYRVDKTYNLASDRDTSYTASVSFAITEENGETFWQVEEKEVESQPLPPDGEPMHKEDLEDLLEYGVEDCKTILEELKDKKADCEAGGDTKGAKAASAEIRETEEKLTLYQSLESRYAAGEDPDTLWREYLQWQITKNHPEAESEQSILADFLGYTAIGREMGSWQGVSTRMRAGLASLAYSGTAGEELFTIYLTTEEEATVRESLERYRDSLVEGPAWDPLAVRHWYTWAEEGQKVRLNVGTMRIELIGKDGKYRHTDIAMEDWETLNTLAANCYADPPEGMNPENDMTLGYTGAGREIGKYAVVGNRMRVSAFFDQFSVKSDRLDKFAVFLTPEEEQAVKAVVDRNWDLFTYEYRGNWEKMVSIQFTWSLDPDAENEYDRSATLLVWPEDRKVELIGMGGNCHHAELPEEDWQILIDVAKDCYEGTGASIVKES